jgi:hypothetical protein
MQPASASHLPVAFLFGKFAAVDARRIAEMNYEKCAM